MSKPPTFLRNFFLAEYPGESILSQDKKLEKILSFLQNIRRDSDQFFLSPLYFNLCQRELENSLLEEGRTTSSVLEESRGKLLPSLFGLSEHRAKESKSIPLDDSAPLALSLGETGSPASFRPNFLPPSLKFCQIFMARSGGMGVVFFGWDSLKKRPVVVKTFRPDLFSRNTKILSQFIREAHIWLSLKKHLFVVQSYDLEIVDGIPFLFLEFFPGLPSQDLAGNYSPWELLQLAYQVSRAISDIKKIHPNFIHGDIKPSNLLYSREKERVKLTDMGLSTFTEQDLYFSTGKIHGTPLYMAPERWNSLPPSESSDLYSLGATLYELVTGHPPFLSENIEGLSKKHREEAPPSLPLFSKYPEDLVSLIFRCLDKDHQKRPSSFLKLRDELRELMKKFEGGKVYLWKSRVVEWTYPFFSLGALTSSSQYKVSEALYSLFLELSKKRDWDEKDFQTLLQLSQLKRAFGFSLPEIPNFSKIPLGPALWKNLSLEGLYLPHGKLDGLDLSGKNLKGAFLEGADLKGTILREANLEEACLEGADLAWADLTGSTLVGANIKMAHLEKTKLLGADLTGAQLQGARFTRTDLEGATFDRANLTGIQMVQVNLRKGQLAGGEIALDGRTLVFSEEDPLIEDSYCFFSRGWKTLVHLRELSNRSKEGSNQDLVNLLGTIKKIPDPALLQILPDFLDFPSSGIVRKTAVLIGEICQQTWERLLNTLDLIKSLEKELAQYEKELEILIKYLGKGLLGLQRASQTEDKGISKRAQKHLYKLIGLVIQECVDAKREFFRDPERVAPLMARALNSPHLKVRTQAQEWFNKRKGNLGSFPSQIFQEKIQDF